MMLLFGQAKSLLAVATKEEIDKFHSTHSIIFHEFYRYNISYPILIPTDFLVHPFTIFGLLTFPKKLCSLEYESKIDNVVNPRTN